MESSTLKSSGDPFEDATIGDLDLEERRALRRVEGLGTELEDITEVEYRQVRLERVVLVGVWTQGSIESATRSMAELARLAETAGCTIVDALMQRRDAPDTATYIGSGKVKELRDIVMLNKADTVICDGELSPSQLRKLEDTVKVKVVDRTWLILDIFAQHAKSKEGKAQVSLAQMQYMIPRLRGWGEALSRQAGGRAGGGTGGVGTRGPGETKLETDRRRINNQISKLKRELKDMARTRNTQRSARHASGVPQVAIAGYTNAGKSSLLNRLTGAGVLVENALFATLDPTVRKAHTPNGRDFTISDTVGFVRHLPHQLIEAFRSTLEEVSNADLILHVVDGTDADPEGQLSAVREVLAEIDAANIPEIVVINKIDQADPIVVQRILRREKHSMAVSAHSGEGIDQLLAEIERVLPGPKTQIDLVIPYEHGEYVHKIVSTGIVQSLEHIDSGTHVVAVVTEQLAHELAGLNSNG
jgi:GTP-binding protein HflX